MKTHWGRLTHIICVSKLTIIGSDNGLLPDRRQAIIWTNAGILLIGPMGTNFSEILIEIYTFSFKKMHLKMSSTNGGHFVLASISLQNKIWSLLDRSTILPKFICNKEGKLARPTQVLPVRVRGPALILKTAQCVDTRVGVNSIPELELQVNSNSNSGIGIGIGIEIGGIENGIGIENPGIGIGIENRNWFFCNGYRSTY